MRRFAGVLAVLGTLALVGAATAFASYVLPYASGEFHAGESFTTPGYGPRDYNRVYHHAGGNWWLRYCHVDGSCSNIYPGSVNPLVDAHNDSYGKAWCHNVDDNYATIWTCQTTTPN